MVWTHPKCYVQLTSIVKVGRRKLCECLCQRVFQSFLDHCCSIDQSQMFDRHVASLPMTPCYLFLSFDRKKYFELDCYYRRQESHNLWKRCVTKLGAFRRPSFLAAQQFFLVLKARVIRLLHFQCSFCHLLLTGVCQVKFVPHQMPQHF